MVLHNYNSKYCEEKIEPQRKNRKLWIIFLYIMYLTTFDIKIIIHFQAKNNFMLVTSWTERYEEVQHILKYILSWCFRRLHIMWIYHCNVIKTNQLKKNVEENIWCHQKMNRKKYWYFDNDPYAYMSTLVSLSYYIFHVFSPVLPCPLRCSVRSLLLPFVVFLVLALSMLFLIISLYSCSSRFSWQMMSVSFTCNTTCTASWAGTVFPFV